MTFLIVLAAAAGITLVGTGLPPLRRIGLTDRVEPYLNGLGANVSPLGSSGGSRSLRALLQARCGQMLPGAGPGLVERLASSGTGMTVVTYRTEQLLWAVGGGCLAIVATIALGWMGGNLHLPSTIVVGAFGVAGGAAARDWRLSRQIVARRERVRQEMPVAIDLLTLAIMAGEAVPAAFARVGTMLNGDVGREFRHVFGSIRAGAASAEAIRELPVRLPHPAAARLADSLCVAMERGAPLAEALRAQADDLRESRRRDLLELGGRREIAMLVPVVFLILPTIVAFVLVPGLVSLDLVVP